MDYRNVVLFSDLDGTLFDDDTKVSERNREAIRRFCQSGGTFCISSGRIPSNLQSVLNGVMVNGPCVLFNGSAVYDWGKKQYIHRCYLNMPVVEKFLKQVIGEFPEVDVQVYPGDDICFISSEQTANMEFVSQHRPCVFTNIERVGKPWMKVLMQGDPETLKKIRGLGQEIPGIGRFVATSADYLEILPEGISKGTALKQALELPELAGKTSVAIGDYFNDLELLEMADVAVAPANALKEVKERVDYIVCDNNQGAVAACIEETIPGLA